MRIALGLIALAVALGGALVFTNGMASSSTCETGHAQGFAAIRWSPNVAASIPPRFTKTPQFFWRRHNCTGRGVYVRRVDRGVYDISFPGLGYRLAISDAISQEGVSSSAQPFGTGVFRIITRGPLSENGILARRDSAFSIVVY